MTDWKTLKGSVTITDKQAKKLRRPGTLRRLLLHKYRRFTKDAAEVYAYAQVLREQRERIIRALKERYPDGS